MARFTLGAMALCVLAALLLCPQAGAAYALRGLTLCAAKLIPTLFPFLVLSNFLLALGAGQWLSRVLGRVMEPLFHVRGSGSAALALGCLGGYPAGAGMIAALLEQQTIDPAEAGQLLLFCNNAGPSFILSVAGVGLFSDLSVGVLLWGVHLLSAAAVGVLLRPKARPAPPSPAAPRPLPPLSTALTAAVSKSTSAMLSICANVVLFQVLSGFLGAFLSRFPVLPPELSLLVGGILELSGGICGLSAVSSPLYRLVLCGFLLGWGGLSVAGQSMTLLEGSGLPMAPYLRAKALQGGISAVMLLLLARCPLLLLPVGILFFFPLAGGGGIGYNKPTEHLRNWR